MVLIYLTVDVMTFHANFLSFYFRVLVCENYDVNTEPKKKKKETATSFTHASLLLHCYIPAVFFMG